MKTYLISVNGYRGTIWANSINDVRKSLMKEGRRSSGFLAWVYDSSMDNLLGQVRYDCLNQRFTWYRDPKTINVLNKDGSLGRRL